MVCRVWRWTHDIYYVFVCISDTLPERPHSTMYQYVHNIYVCHPIHDLPHMCMYFWHSTRKTTFDNVPTRTQHICLPPYTRSATHVYVFLTLYQKDHTRQYTSTYPIYICLPPYTPFATYVYVFLSPFILQTLDQKVAPCICRLYISATLHTMHHICIIDTLFWSRLRDIPTPSILPTPYQQVARVFGGYIRTIYVAHGV